MNSVCLQRGRKEHKMNELIVNIPGGAIEGMYAEDKDVRIFRGVPYAAPPVGPLRWRAPQPVQPWQGIKQTKYYANANMHIRPSMRSFYGREFDQVEYPISEDCLYLNIWAPLAEKAKGCPVAVWFHGGDSHANKAIFNGENFARRGVILITVGFRTGPFAGLCHKELSREAEKELGHYTSGNYGLLDQIAAVKWVRANIAAFGGDPDRVTVFGQSAGGTVVERLISTPLLKGELFGAIMQSAGGIDPRYIVNEATLAESEAYGEQILKEQGIQNIAEARQMSAEDVLHKFSGGPELNMAYFSPKPDGYSLLYTPDRTSYENKILEGIHFMIGTTKHEGMAYDIGKTSVESLQKFLQKAYGEQWTEYWKNAGVQDDATAQMIRRQDSADVKMACAYSWVQLQNEQGRPAPYVYLFSKEAPGPESVGAFHSGEHAYVFKNMDKVPWRGYTEQDHKLADIMNQYWVNFMKTGDPNGSGLPKWEPTEDMKNDPWIMELGQRVGMIRPEETKVSNFIKKFCLEYYKNKN